MANTDFTGTVGRDVKLEYTKSGNPRLKFSVCDEKSKKTPSGDWETVAKQWLNVTVWGPLAEHLDEHVKSGERVKVTGELYMRTYESRDGSQGVSLDVTAWGVQVSTKARARTGGWSQDGSPTSYPSGPAEPTGYADDDSAPF